LGPSSLYDRIHSENIGHLRSGTIELDPFLSAGTPDPRRGVSLVIPMGGMPGSYESMVRRFSDIEPGQYYYPRADLHVTVFDFLQCRAGYEGGVRLDEAFRELAVAALASTGAFSLSMRGIVFSRSAGLIAGYDGGRLVALRAAIRKLMRDRGLMIDERYESSSAHASFVRFRRSLLDPEAFAAAIEASRELELGGREIAQVDLVEHDWYNSAASRRLIGSIALE
jgi:hypothetical protein